LSHPLFEKRRLIWHFAFGFETGFLPFNDKPEPGVSVRDGEESTRLGFAAVRMFPSPHDIVQGVL
jgi:hypothetical protein